MDYQNYSKQQLIDELNQLENKYNLLNELYNNTQAEHKRVVEEHAKENEQASLILQNTSDLIYSISADGIYLFANKAYADFLTLAPHELIGKNLYDIFPEDQAQLRFQLMQQVIETATHLTAEFDLKIKNGETKHTHLLLEPIKDKSGKVISLIGIARDITERKQIEINLRENEEKFRNIFEHSVVGISITSIDGHLKTNPAFSQILGYSEQELQQMRWQDLTYCDDIENDISIINAILTGEINAKRWEKRYIHKDGRIVWGDVCTVLQRDNNGNQLYFITVINDITDRKQTEILLTESESRFRKIFEEGPYGMVLVNRSFQFTMVNKSFCSILGYTESELLHRCFNDITHPDDVAMNIENVKKLIKNEISIYNTEKRYIRKDGTVIWCSLTVTSHFQSDGQYLYNIAIISDITESKQVEILLKEKSEEIEAQNEEYYQINEELNQANEELSQTNFDLVEAHKKIEKSEEKFRRAFYTNPDAITINRVNDGMYVSVNHGFSNMLGYTEKEAFGKTSLDLNIWQNAEDRKILVSLLETNGFVENLEIKLRTKGGENLDCLVSSTILELDGVEHLFSVTRDISERKKNETELINAKNKAEESDRLKTAFLQNMSHEIRTPMNAIMGFAALLPKQYNNKTKLESYAQIINQRSTDLLEIINEILDVAKIESGQLPVNIEECNLAPLFNELSLFFEEAQKRQHKQHIAFSIQAECKSAFLHILTDKLKLKQILINLIGNAFKFTNRGTIAAGCRLDENNKLLFYVSDTGIGISPNKADFIFERFTQLESTAGHLYGGTGLGLSIVKGLLELMQGKVWFTSEEGRGSTFYFNFPYEQLKNTSSDTVQVEDFQYNFSTKTILIVEDDKYNSDYLFEVLLDTGITIINSTYGKEAVEIATNRDIDLVLMDIRLPDMDGYTATRLIRQQKPTLSIIAQTAYASPDDKIKAIDAGCCDYISKPIMSDMLLSLINKKLRKH